MKVEVQSMELLSDEGCGKGSMAPAAVVLGKFYWTTMVFSRGQRRTLRSCATLPFPPPASEVPAFHVVHL
ncbi:hypothetical protein CF651_09145 [Paenibacillus rigui]|uniref:Uncharacterized protein n=1 Tax=Paenibacillus rigui TaxID=554312 RepID=A0A229UT51_9BACL|nr:hypothetical protein CF651_09145 [Paenibacillus rigui]